MNRRIRFTVAAIALLFAAAACSNEGPAADAPRVIVVFVVDSWGARHAGCYGAEGDPTPAADALAARGVRFERAWAHSSWTLPSFGSLLASVVPTALWEPDSNATLRDTLHPFPRVLADSGYDTFACWNSSLLAPRFGLDAGFASEDFDVFPSRNDFTRSADETVRDALAWLDRKPSDRPVLLAVHVFDPHLSYTPLRVTSEGPSRGDRFEPGVPAFDDAAQRDAQTKRWIRGLHLDEVRAVDAALGSLVAGLEERGRFGDALIVVTGAHGEETFEHGGFGHGHGVYEEQIAVPLIVRLPRDAHAGTTVPALVRHVDVAPTILDLVGVSIPDSYQGMSLRPLWDATASSDSPGSAGSTAPRVAIAESLIAGPQRKAVRIGDDKLVTDDARQPLELYDLATDPEERDNRLDRDPETAERLRAALVRWVGTLTEAPSPHFSLADDPDLRDRLDAVSHPGRAR